MPTHRVSADELGRAIAVRTGQFHGVVVARKPALGQVVGKAFDTNRSLLLPGAARRMVRVRELMLRRSPAHLLVVGHCDTSGDDAVNDPLSLERAEAACAFLRDDAAGWLANYGAAAPASRRWGRAEDLIMIGALPGASARAGGEDPIRWFQGTRGLPVTGNADDATRKRLIEEYMRLDGPPFAEQPLHIEFTAHGCGEHFPLDESGRKLDANAADGARDALDRRVEFFFFGLAAGVQPPPPGPNSNKGSPEYPLWRKAAELDFATVLADGEDDVFIRLHIGRDHQASMNDRLRLVSSDGAYDETRVVADDGEPSDTFTDVVFTRVKTDRSYSLEVTPAQGSAHFLFENVPFEDLAQLPPSPGPELDPLAPEPEG